MVDSISDSLYGMQGASAYSIGSYTQMDKTDTEVFEDVFQDALDAAGEGSQTSQASKIDDYKLGVPAGMEIEGMDGMNVSDVSAASASDDSRGGSGGGSSSDEDEEEYDEMDLNQDGTVSSAEMIIYEMLHGSSGSDSSKADSANLSEALSAYSAA